MLTVEFLGPPGVGKTTTFRALRCGSPAIAPIHVGMPDLLADWPAEALHRGDVMHRYATYRAARADPRKAVAVLDEHLWQAGLSLWCVVRNDRIVARYFRSLPPAGGVVVMALQADELVSRHLARQGRTRRPDDAVALLAVCGLAVEVLSTRGLPYLEIDASEPAADNARQVEQFVEKLRDQLRQ
jgi:MoxR-like ATPase